MLVIRFSSLGDILLTAPTLRVLRRRFPDGHIDLLVAQEYAEAAALIPGPDRVLTFDRRSGWGGLLRLRSDLSRRYSILVDLQNSLRSSFLRVTTLPTLWMKARRYRFRRWLLVQFKWNLYRRIIPVPMRYLDAVHMTGAEDDGLGLHLQIPDTALADARAILTDWGLTSSTIAILCPGARHFTKRWPSEHWKVLGEKLTKEGQSILVVGAADESVLVQDIAGSIPASKPLIGYPIPTLAALMQQAHVVVSNDSGLMHLAGGVGARVVAIFGPTVEEFGFFPFRARSRVLEQKLPCRPCSAMGTETCKEKHFRCMLDTRPEHVLNAIQELSAV